MKKSIKVNKFLAGGWVVFAILLAWSARTVLAPPRPPGTDDGKTRATNPGSVPFPSEKTWDLTRIRQNNLFLGKPGSRSDASPTGGPAGEKAPELKKNDIRDPATGEVFTFLGVFRRGSGPEACFQRAAKEGAQKLLFLSTGGSLTARLRLEDVRDTGVRVRRDKDVVELKVFAIDLKEERK